MAKKGSGISGILAKMTVLPLLVLSIVTLVFVYLQISTSVSREVENELSIISQSSIKSMDMLYPGEYDMYQNDEEMLVTKGNVIMNSNYEYIDNMKASTNVDFTLFYGDVRIITTICDSKGNRIIGTNANAQIVSDVQKNDKSVFYEKMNVFSKKYYCYYTPLHNEKGEVIGMLAVGMPSERVSLLILKATLPILILIMVALLLTHYWSSRYTKEFKSLTKKLQNSLFQTSNGKLSNTVPPELLSRSDEFGDMARSIVNMQSSLRTLVEQDALTGLSNRRFGQERLDQMLTKSQDNKAHFSLALGDIDFFKKFNDTYGHECGDIVLKETAHIIQDHIKDYGFCSRWGGEEFLIVFTQGKYDTHKRLMEELIDRISHNKLSYIDQDLNVTMTFGLIDVYGNYKADDALKRVDELLYMGKEAGRNRLVTDDMYGKQYKKG